MRYQLGIDFGTTYTAAAVHRNGQVEIQTLGNRAAAVPSVIFLRADETILVGDPANRRGVSDPSRVAREFKRRLGDPTPILVGGTPYSADALTAKLLRWVVDVVVERQGGPPDKIALSHPANWGPYKQDLLTQAVRLADLPPVVLLTEPQAAAISYASTERVEVGTVVAVYDLGGGTFDAAVLRKTSEGFTHLGSPEGIERLGGIDFDEAVYSHVLRATGDAVAQLDPADPSTLSAVARLRSEVVDAKEALSGDSDTSIPVLLPNVQTEVRLTRAEFEAMIRPTLADTMSALRRTLRSAELKPEDVDVVLLVGGSSRIPMVAQLVSAELNRPVAIDVHPKHAIATGAALAAAQAMGIDAEASAVLPAVVVATPAAPAPTPVTPAVAEDSEVDEDVSAEPDAKDVSTEPDDEPAGSVDEQAVPPLVAAAAPDPVVESRPHPDVPAPGATRGKRTGLLVGAIVAALVAVVAAVGLLTRGGPNEDPAGTTSSEGVTDQLVFTEADLGPAGARLEVPQWPSAPGDEENSTRYTDPETGMFIETVWTDDPVGDLHGGVNEASEEFEAEDSSYELVAISDYDFPPAEEAVTWEFTVSDGADHGMYAIFVNDGITYGVGVEAPEEHWFEAMGYWQQSVDTFSDGTPATTSSEGQVALTSTELGPEGATVGVPLEWHADSTTGRLPTPARSATPRQGPLGVRYTDPATEMNLETFWIGGPPISDADAFLEAESDLAASQTDSYELVEIVDAEVTGADTAATWEYAYSEEQVQGKILAMSLGGSMYILGVESTSEHWEAAQLVWGQVVGSFDSGAVTAAGGIPGQERSALINEIILDGDRYVVSYETFGYTDELPGRHVHFFFDTVPPDEAGQPGDGPWFVYGGPNPFREWTVDDRPDGARQLCILVARDDHSVVPSTGNCVELPPG